MTLVTTPEHALTFGPLNFIGTRAELTANGFTFEALGDDADWGNPQPIEVAIESWLQDGANISIERWENRELFIRVQVTAADSDKLALAEELLVLQCGRPNLLVWTPPDGEGAPCVFEVATSKPEQVTNDQNDLRVEATYGLRVKAFPFVRAVDETVVSIPAPSGTQAITSVDACSSFTGWAAAVSHAVSGGTSTNTSGTAGGKVFNQAAITLSTGITLWTLKLTRTGLSASITTTPYIRVAMSITNPTAIAPSLTFKLNGVVVPVAVTEGSLYWFDTTGLGLGTTLNTFEVSVEFSNVVSGTTLRVDIDDISRSNVIGTQSTNRQLARTLPVLGSARTQGTISIEDATNALGDVLVHTMPAIPGMLQPNLRVNLTSGNSSTGDTSRVSGFFSSLASLHTFDLAASALKPGTYALVAYVRHSSSGDRVMTWAARSRMGSSNLGGAQTGTTTVTLAANVWTIVDLARLTLPPVKVGADGLVRIELTGTSNMDLDEAWLFNLDDGDLTWVSLGTAAPAAGGSSNRLWIDSPTPENPTYQYYVGTDADRSDSYWSLDVKSEGHHELVPSSVNVFTVTTNAIASLLGFRYFRRSHTRIRKA